MPKRREAPAAPTLASLWMPPAELPIEDGAGRPVACVATTYTFHATLLETDLLPRFLGLRFDPAERERAFVVEREEALSEVRVSVLVDKAHVDRQQTTLRWDQLPVRVPGGLQHAKVSLLLWERCLRLIVASANLTYPGYRRNREMAAALDFFDGRESVPRDVARDAIRFLRELEPWVGGVREARQRWLVTLSDAEARLASWKRAPAAFGPREMPQVRFVGGRPGGHGRRLRSPIEAVGKIWGTQRPADRLVVMTPFVGDGNLVPLVQRLGALFYNQPARAQLVVPEGPSQDKKHRVAGLPRRLHDAWIEEFSDPEVHLVPRTREGERIDRALHAKGLMLVCEAAGQRAGLSLLLCGSSNFSSHGMGLGVANVEANLCFLDRPGKSGQNLESRLPVDWEADLEPRAIWPDSVEPSEDDEPKDADALPASLEGASYDERSGVVCLRFRKGARSEAETWRLSLPGGSAPGGLARADEPGRNSAPGELRFQLTDEQRSGPVTVLRIAWPDAGGLREGVLPLQVASRDDLLPVEELRNLSIDVIIACLLSGRDPADLVGPGPPWIRTKRGPGKPDDLTADPSQYTLYRVRRQARALTAMGKRICDAPRTREALHYRLLLDPLGPVSLAKALVAPLLKGQALSPASNPVAVRPADSQPVVFMLAEVALVLGHVARRVKKATVGANGALLEPFREAAVQVLGLAEPYRGGVAANLGGYLREVEAEIRPWLGGEALLAD